MAQAANLEAAFVVVLVLPRPCQMAGSGLAELADEFLGPDLAELMEDYVVRAAPPNPAMPAGPIEGAPAPGDRDAVHAVHAGSWQIPDNVQIAGLTPAESFVKSLDFMRWVHDILPKPLVVSNTASIREGHKELRSLVEYYFGKARTLHTTKAAVSELTGMPSRKVEPLLGALACSMMELDRHAMAHLQERIAGGGCQLLAFLEVARYDETPMKVAKQEKLGHQLAPADRAPASSTDDPPPAQDPLAHGPSVRSASTSKLFATQNKVCMLVKTPAPDLQQHGKGELLAFVGTNLSVIQILENTTTNTLFAALQEGSCIPPGTDAYDMRVRIVTTDQGPSNISTEQRIAQRRGSLWSHIHCHCQVHIVATCHKRTFEELEEHLSAAINMALYLSFGEHMRQFRQSLAAIIRKRLVIRQGRPPSAARVYREWVLQHFCQAGPQSRTKRALLSVLANGDWTQRGEVQFFVPAGLDYSQPEIEEKVVKGLLLAFASRKFRTYPRHRWLGAEAALDDLLLLECCHGLCAAAFYHLCHGVDPLEGGSVAEGRSLHAQGQTALDADDLLEHPPPLQTSPAPEAEQGLDPAPPSPTAVGSQQAALESGNVDLAVVNQHRLVKVGRWWQSDPLAYLMLVRLCLQPLGKLMGSYIEKSGHHWLEEQRLKQSVLQILGQRTAPPTPTALLEVVNAVGEGQFFEDLRSVLDSAEWQHVPSTHWKVKFQTLTFRITSKLGCVVFELGLQQSRTFPLRLFKLLEAPVVIMDVLRTPRCILDAFSITFLSKYVKAQHLSEEGHAILSLIAQTVYPDIILLGVESRTHPPSAENSISADTGSCNQAHQCTDGGAEVQGEGHAGVGVPGARPCDQIVDWSNL